MFKQVDQKSIVDVIRDQIWSQILEGHLQPGSKLPPEKELMHQLGVSRPTLREALREMAGEGLLEIRHGQGTFIRKPSAALAIQGEVFSLLLVSETIRDVQAVRWLLEPAIAAQVAEKATAEQFKELEELLLADRENSVERGAAFNIGWRFHHHLARITGNSVMAKILNILYEMIKAAEQHLYEGHFDQKRDIDDHLALLEVIKKRDPELARAAMEAHLRTVDEDLSHAIEAEQQTARSARPPDALE